MPREVEIVDGAQIHALLASLPHEKAEEHEAWTRLANVALRELGTVLNIAATHPSIRPAAGAWIDWRLDTAAAADLPMIGADELAALIRLLSRERGTRIPIIRLWKAVGRWDAALATCLGDRDRTVRRAAAAVFAESPVLTPVAVAVAEALFAALSDRDGTVRKTAAFAITQRLPDDPRLPGAVIDLLVDREANVRKGAALSLCWLGERALPALARLTALLDDESPGVRDHAAMTLGRIGPRARPALPSLAKLLDSTSAFVRATATEAILVIDPDAPEGRLARSRAEHDRHRIVRQAVGHAEHRRQRPR